MVKLALDLLARSYRLDFRENPLFVEELNSILGSLTPDQSERVLMAYEGTLRIDALTPVLQIFVNDLKRLGNNELQIRGRAAKRAREAE